MKKAKIVELKSSIDVGTKIPINAILNNTVGYWAEDKLKELGHVHNPGKGVDFPEFGTKGIECKTRNEKSTSAHTVGAMSLNELRKYPNWDSSPLKDKIQDQLRIKFDKENRVVTESRVVDFSDSEIQDRIRFGYEKGLQDIIKDPYSFNNTKTYGPVIWQRIKNTDNWQLRITNAGMKQLLILEKSMFGVFFEYV